MTAKQHPEHGEVIPLIWDFGVDEWYVRGHVPFAEAIEAVTAHEDDANKRFGSCRHTYGRWTFATADMTESGVSRLFRTCKPGRGAFPVTVVLDLDEQERQQRIAAERKARDEVQRAAILATWPKAYDIKTGWGTGAEAGQWCRFSLPGRKYEAACRVVDGVVQVEPPKGRKHA